MWVGAVRAQVLDTALSEDAELLVVGLPVQPGGSLLRPDTDSPTVRGQPLTACCSQHAEGERGGLPRLPCAGGGVHAAQQAVANSRVRAYHRRARVAGAWRTLSRCWAARTAWRCSCTVSEGGEGGPRPAELCRRRSAAATRALPAIGPARAPRVMDCSSAHAHPLSMRCCRHADERGTTQAAAKSLVWQDVLRC
jgi:hypothetical protein